MTEKKIGARKKTGIGRSRKVARTKPEQSEVRTGSEAHPYEQSLEIRPEERHQLIAEAAYYRSERRGFRPGFELSDWLEAEAEIDKRLSRRG